MGNDVQNLRKDLIDLDIEELRINRELYNLQSQINAQLALNKKVRIKTNYKQYAERKLKALEEKKRLLSENENNNKNINIQINNNKNKNIYNVIETGDAKNEEKNCNNDNDDNNKLNLISKSSKDSKNMDKLNVINKIEKKINDKNNEMISSSGSGSKNRIKTIYTKKKSKINNKEELKNNKDNEEDEDKKINDINDIINNNNRYNINNDNNIKEDLEENLNINEYKKKFFEKLSSLGPRSNINKSMDNKNSSIVEELEVVGLSQNEILKDKLSDFFVGTSVASSSKCNQNNSSMHNNYYKNRPKSEISGINRQLISSSKSNNDDNDNDNVNDNANDNDNDKGINSINIQNINDNCGESEEFIGRGNKKRFGTGATGEKYDTEESINNKETGSNTDEKYKDNNNDNHENVNERKLLKNNRNKSYFVLQDSSMIDNSQMKESEN